MAELPSNLPLPNPPHDKEQLFAWAIKLVTILKHEWIRLVYTLNAYVTSGSLDDRTNFNEDEPPLDQTFFQEDNTDVVSIASGGVWEAISPRRGTGTMASGSSTSTVLLTPNELTSSFAVDVEFAYSHGGVWITTKLASSFVVNVATSASGGAESFTYRLWRD